MTAAWRHTGWRGNDDNGDRAVFPQLERIPRQEQSGHGLFCIPECLNDGFQTSQVGFFQSLLESWFGVFCVVLKSGSFSFSARVLPSNKFSKLSKSVKTVRFVAFRLFVLVV